MRDRALRTGARAGGSSADVSNYFRSGASRTMPVAPRSAAVEGARGRLAVVSAVFLVAFGAIIFRLFDLALSPPEARTASAAAADPFSRADILDRDGELLARDVVLYDISVDPGDLEDPIAAAEAIGFAMPELDAEVLRARFTSGKQFAYILRDATPKQADQIHDLGIPGVLYDQVGQRAYPQGSLFSHVLGYVDVDNKGIAGVELARDSVLREHGRAGAPLQLSLDTEVQYTVRDVLSQGIKDYGASGGVGIVLDVRSGELLSLVSLPDFDPNRPSGPADQVMLNRATSALYEMGSTFKTFTFAAGFENGTLRLGDHFDARKPFKVGGRLIKDFFPQNRVLSTTEVFLHSSNIGAAQMGLKLGAAKQRAFLESLGMLAPSPVELPEVTPPLVQDRWGPVETATISYGYGISVSPVQLASGIAALANDGVYVAPTVLKRPADEVPAGRRVVSLRTSEMVRMLMRANVVQGTGRQSDVPGYDVAGKTGTAQKMTGASYAANKRVSSFVAVFPARAPRYLVLVMLDEPTRVLGRAVQGPTGGATAAPLSGLIIRRIAPIMGLPPDEEDFDTQEVNYKRS